MTEQDNEPDGDDLLLGLGARLYAPKGRRLVWIASQLLRSAQRYENAARSLVARAQRLRAKAQRIIERYEPNKEDDPWP